MEPGGTVGVEVDFLGGGGARRIDDGFAFEDCFFESGLVFVVALLGFATLPFFVQRSGPNRYVFPQKATS